MIITLSGKPCSGKSSVGKMFCEKYGFEFMSTGGICREIAKQCGYNSILEMQQSKDVKKMDKLVDNLTAKIGKERFDENILIDSRLAWHFIPNSFKVFVDVDWEIAGTRLIEANRETEQAGSKEEATKLVKERWEVENARYKKLYNVDNLNLKNYDLVISSNKFTIEQIVEKIYKAYQQKIVK